MNLKAMLTGEEPGPIAQILHSINPGSFGEYLISFALKKVEGYNKIFKNIYIPYKEKTSEIDIIMIHEKGIFVFESKNYSGWIFGDATSINWTQSLPNKQKNQFYNPILQNQTHIKAITEYLNLQNSQIFHSYIVFNEKCKLKKIPSPTNNFVVLKRLNMLKHLRAELNNQNVIFTQNEVDNLCSKLNLIANASRKTKKEHIKNIKKLKRYK